MCVLLFSLISLAYMTHVASGMYVQGTDEFPENCSSSDSVGKEVSGQQETVVLEMCMWALKLVPAYELRVRHAILMRTSVM